MQSFNRREFLRVAGGAAPRLLGERDGLYVSASCLVRSASRALVAGYPVGETNTSSPLETGHP